MGGGRGWGEGCLYMKYTLDNWLGSPLRSMALPTPTPSLLARPLKALGLSYLVRGIQALP